MLRDYQQSVYDRIREDLRTHHGVCAVLPCRSGKSYIMKEIVDSAARKGSSVLVIAHRRLLLDQHKTLIGGCRIESVFTEANHLGENGKVDLIIIDEAHLSGAESYRKVCEYYGCKVIGFTATASRLDGKPLSLFDCIINGISADDLIKRGNISPYDLYAPKLNFSLDGVSMSGGDYNNTQLSDVMTDRKIYGDIIKYYRELADGKQAIAYCTSVKHSESVRDLFNDNGISAVHMDANTQEKRRQELMRDFRNGKYSILCNVGLISEGITLPECECCLLLRPTQSEALYIQQSCRCLTPSAGKRATIIDYVGNVFAHGMPTEPRMYSLTEQKKPRNASREPDIIVRQCKHCFRTYSGNSRICPYCSADNGKTKKEIEYERKAELERIEKIEKKKYKDDLKACKELSDYIAFAKSHGYKIGWAYQRYKIVSQYRKNIFKNNKKTY